MPSGIASAGTFFVQIINGTGYSPPESLYRLSVDYSTQTSGVEIEVNDVTPQAIDFGQSIVGQLSSTDDIDKFSVVASTAGTITLSFSSVHIGRSGRYVLFLDSAYPSLYTTKCTITACLTGISLPSGIA